MRARFVSGYFLWLLDFAIGPLPKILILNPVYQIINKLLVLCNASRLTSAMKLKYITIDLKADQLNSRHKLHKKAKSFTSQVAHGAGAYLRFL